MLLKVFRGANPPEPTRVRIPRKIRIYAIGDIHGRADLLRILLDRIRDDARDDGSLVNYLVFLGDYIDRGPASREVLDILTAGPPPGFGAIHLKGNHEAALLRFLQDPRNDVGWLSCGGPATLRSYGVPVSDTEETGLRAAALRDALDRALPLPHRMFLKDLRTRVVVGDYLFVHAGIRPGIPLPSQQEEDLLRIRDPFLTSRIDHGKIVVHGHSISERPEIRANRIGIDTGAYRTGRLTCAVLTTSARRFLST